MIIRNPNHVCHLGRHNHIAMIMFDSLLRRSRHVQTKTSSEHLPIVWTHVERAVNCQPCSSQKVLWNVSKNSIVLEFVMSEPVFNHSEPISNPFWWILELSGKWSCFDHPMKIYSPLEIIIHQWFSPVFCHKKPNYTIWKSTERSGKIRALFLSIFNFRGREALIGAGPNPSWNAPKASVLISECDKLPLEFFVFKFISQNTEQHRAKEYALSRAGSRVST